MQLPNRHTLIVWSALGAVLALLPFVARADAAPFTPELEADYAYAAEWWGAAPTGCTSIDRQVVTRAEVAGVDGEATQPPPGAEVACVIYVAAEQTPCRLRETMVHEYGHLLGYGHSEDPANIMYPEGNGACDAEWRAQQIVKLRGELLQTHERCLRLRAPRRLSLCRLHERQWRHALAVARSEAALG